MGFTAPRGQGSFSKRLAVIAIMVVQDAKRPWGHWRRMLRPPEKIRLLTNCRNHATLAIVLRWQRIGSSSHANVHSRIRFCRFTGIPTSQRVVSSAVLYPATLPKLTDFPVD